MDEIILKNKPSYYWIDIIKLNKIDLKKNKTTKGNIFKM